MKENGDAKKSKVGLREIASEARVSVATVSRVLNGNNRVDPAIREVVLEAAAKLHVDLSQRNKTKALAFLLSNRAMLHAFHSRILLGAEAYCAANGWDMVFLSFNYSPTVPWKELHLPKVVQRHDVVRAVVLAGTNSANLLELLDHKGIAYSVLGNNVIGGPRSLKGDTVYSDDIQGGQEMTRYLISLGHRDIWFVGNVRLPWFARHYEGYRHAMVAAGLDPRLSGLEFEDETEMGHINAKSILAQGGPCTAILAGNDQTAHGVYKGLRDNGLKVPDDVSVAGCDDTVSTWLYPGLTSTREFPEQLGQQLVKLVLGRIAQPNLAPQVVTIPTQLIKRESCRPVATAKQLLSAAR
ncbi:MAG: LacI family DNA-binding transcriptional regulator [Acidobacteriaceae bacterium]